MIQMIALSSAISMMIFGFVFVCYLEFFGRIKGRALHWTDAALRTFVPTIAAIFTVLSAFTLTGCGIYLLIARIVTF